MRDHHWNLLGVFSLVLFISIAAVGAPGPQPRNVDSIQGTFTLQLDKCPVVVVPTRTPEGDWVPVDYWLVFTTREAEQLALKNEEGATVKAVGKVCGGGSYRYLIVSGIVPAKE